MVRVKATRLCLAPTRCDGARPTFAWATGATSTDPMTIEPAANPLKVRKLGLAMFQC